MGMKVSRNIDPKAYSRAQMLDSPSLLQYFDHCVLALNSSFDRFRSAEEAPGEEVTMCVDAVVALWTEIENRGLLD